MNSSAFKKLYPDIFEAYKKSLFCNRPPENFFSGIAGYLEASEKFTLNCVEIVLDNGRSVFYPRFLNADGKIFEFKNYRTRTIEKCYEILVEKVVEYIDNKKLLK